MSDESSTEKDKLKNTPKRWGAAVLGGASAASIWAFELIPSAVFGVTEFKTPGFIMALILILPLFFSILIATRKKDKWVRFVVSFVLTGIGIPVAYLLWFLVWFNIT